MSEPEVDISLTIPAHNEAENIGTVLRDARAVLAEGGRRYQIVLVDDASGDGTVAAATDAMGDESECLTVVTHDRQRGYAITVCDGLRASRGAILAFMDGDGQFDPADLRTLVAGLESADVVAGIRSRRADPWYRSLVSGVYNNVVRLAFGIRERDFDCGLKVFTRKVWDGVTPIRARSAVFNPEIFFKAHRLGFRVAQVPVQHLPRLAGRRSGGRLVPIARAMRDVIRLRISLALTWRPEAEIRRHPRLPIFALPALLLVVLRVPSLMEPHWYTDEASYVSVARSLLRGRVLYSEIWNNKPPLHLWTIAAEVWAFGSSELGLHLLTLVSGLIAVGAVSWAGRRVLGPGRGLAATLIAAVLLGLPILDAELAIPESLMIAPLSWAGALILVRLARGEPAAAVARRIPVWPVLAGLLAAAAMAYQQTAIAETSALFLAILLSSRVRRLNAFIFLGTAALVTVGWLGTAVLTAGLGRVAFALGGFYVPYTQSVLPTSATRALLHFAEGGAAVALLAFGALLRRGSNRVTWAILLWAGAGLLVPGLAGQPYAHYLTPAAIPIALAIASVPLQLSRARYESEVRRLGRHVPQLAGMAIAVSMASVTGLDWIPAASPSAQLNSSRNLAIYYGGAADSILDSSHLPDWDIDFDSRVPGDAAVAGWIKQHGLSGVSAVVWSSDAWVYSLADLDLSMPTPPIYNNEVLLGQNGPVETFVAALNPVLIVVAKDAQAQFPEISQLLDGSRYVDIFDSNPDAVWVRADAVAQLSRP